MSITEADSAAYPNSRDFASLLAFLDATRMALGIGEQELMRRCGLSAEVPYYLRKKPGAVPRRPTRIKLAEGLGVSWREINRLCGVPDDSEKFALIKEQ